MFVLDTCALSEAMSAHRNEGFTQWLAAQPPDKLATTVTSVAEISHGIMRLTAGKRRDGLHQAAETLFRRLHVHEQDRPCAWLAGTMIALEEKRGRTLKFADATIAAITLHNGGQLVTRDADFDGLATHEQFQGFLIVNPWT